MSPVQKWGPMVGPRLGQGSTLGNSLKHSSMTQGKLHFTVWMLLDAYGVLPMASTA